MSDVEEYCESLAGPGVFDAGHGVSYTPYYADAERTALSGLYLWHPCPTTRERMGTDDPTGVGPNAKTGAAWGYENADDPAHITLIGSVLDRDCGWHGFIRNGQWEPC